MWSVITQPIWISDYIFYFFFSLLHTDLSFLSSSNLVFFVLFISLINEWV